MKFNTYYEKARKKVNNNAENHGYKTELYNNFINEFTDLDKDEFFIKSWRWNIQQNSIQAKEHGQKHIKTLLKEVFNAYYCETN